MSPATRKRPRSPSPSRASPPISPNQHQEAKHPLKRPRRNAAPTSLVEVHAEQDELSSDEPVEEAMPMKKKGKGKNRARNSGRDKDDGEPSRAYVRPPSPTWLKDATVIASRTGAAASLREYYAVLSSNGTIERAPGISSLQNGNGPFDNPLLHLTVPQVSESNLPHTHVGDSTANHAEGTSVADGDTHISPAIELPSDLVLDYPPPALLDMSTAVAQSSSGASLAEKPILWLELPTRAPWLCPYGMCDRNGKPFAQKSALERHVKSQHLGIRGQLPSRVTQIIITDAVCRSRMWSMWDCFLTRRCAQAETHPNLPRTCNCSWSRRQDTLRIYHAKAPAKGQNIILTLSHPHLVII